MLSVSEARGRILGKIYPGPSEWVSLSNAHDRVTASNLDAKRDQPPEAVSAMDGYAVRASDTASGDWLSVIGEIAAGHNNQYSIRPGEACRIFTGGVVPEGADAILIQEDAEREGERVRPKVAVSTQSFIRPAGLDFKAGQSYVSAGTRIDGRHLGLSASLGYGWVNVRRRPRVGLFATGDELVWPGQLPGPAQITSSNTMCLSGLIRGWGGDPVDLGIVPDSEDALERVLAHTGGLDLVLSTGGASVGDHDLVKQVFARCGLVLDFWKIAMRPGKPLIFGTLENTPFLGLPGNPVSAAVCAIMFLRPALRKFLGQTIDLPLETLELADDLEANGPREHYMRAHLEQDSDGRQLIRAVRNQDSSMFAAFASSQALLVRPPHDSSKSAGDLVQAILLDTAIHL